MYVYLGLIARAGINVVIPDFTNGFAMANSRFPVAALHAMLAEHYPSMRVAYAVSASSFAPALAYLRNSSSGSGAAGYLTDGAGRPVFVTYCVYPDYERIRAENPGLAVFFANGESPAANKGGWHSAPFNGYGPRGANSDVFWVAPSLDWQSGTPNASGQTRCRGSPGGCTRLPRSRPRRGSSWLGRSTMSASATCGPPS